MRKAIFKITILCLFCTVPIFSFASIDLCKQKFYDGKKVVTKSCRDPVKYIDEDYIIYNNKVWTTAKEYNSFNQHRSGGGCPNPSCVGSLNIDINPFPTVKKTTHIYTALALDASHVKLLKTNCLSDNEMTYITDGKAVYHKQFKLDIAEPENFKLYQCRGNHAGQAGGQLATDGLWVYINGKRSTLPVTGEIQLINESFLRVGQDIYSLIYNKKNIKEVIDLRKRSDISPQLHTLPGEHLSTDGKHLLYRAEIIDELQNKPPVYIKNECPVASYPLVMCRIKNDEALVLRTNSALWVQYNDDKPREIKISTADNVHYFYHDAAYFIVNDKIIYRVERYGKKYDQVKFHGFLAEAFLSDESFSNQMFDARGVIIFSYARQTLDTNYRSNIFVDHQNPESIYILDFPGNIYTLVKKPAAKGRVVNGTYYPPSFSLSDGRRVYPFIDGKRTISRSSPQPSSRSVP